MNKIVCKICGKNILEKKLTYNIVQRDFLCLDCYIKQFPNTPRNPKAKFL